MQRAMSYSLADLWKDLNSLLARRNTVLHTSVSFYTAAEDVSFISIDRLLIYFFCSEKTILRTSAQHLVKKNCKNCLCHQSEKIQ